MERKLKSIVHFTDVIEMGNYVNTQGVAPSLLTYYLSAVLLHQGPSTNSGHYIGTIKKIGVCLLLFLNRVFWTTLYLFSAHIKDPISGMWYKFNDEIVQNLDSTKFNPSGIEQDLESKIISSFLRVQYWPHFLTDLKISGVKVGKGSHGSSDAYMLVYSRRDASKAQTLQLSPRSKASKLPQWIKKNLDKDIANFESHKVCY